MAAGMTYLDVARFELEAEAVPQAGVCISRPLGDRHRHASRSGPSAGRPGGGSGPETGR